MLFPNPSLWPQFVPNSGEQDASTDPWGFGTVIETQARLWNHLLDANRSVMSFYMPWLQAGPSLWGAALTPLEHEDRAVETAKAAAEGVPDALEIQSRSWNQLLDANRSFWTAALQWPPGTWGSNSGAAAAEQTEEAEEKPAPRRPHATRKSAKSGARASRS